jgi:hypothetical protein
MRFSFVFAWFLVASICSGQSLKEYPYRIWTAKRSGATVEAKFVRFDSSTAILERTDGRKMGISRAALSAEDAAYLDGLAMYVLKSVKPQITVKTSFGREADTFECSVFLEGISSQPRIKPPVVHLAFLAEDEKSGGGVKTVYGGVSSGELGDYLKRSAGQRLVRTADVRWMEQKYSRHLASRSAKDSQVKRMVPLKPQYRFLGYIVHVFYDGEMVAKQTDLDAKKLHKLGLEADWWTVKRDSPVVEYKHGILSTSTNHDKPSIGFDM